uniref:Uncharacterized protein n=1 Tax=Glossina brevipalpis TaxID=37001 RepID=A0A1A9W0U5_9MUSC
MRVLAMPVFFNSGVVSAFLTPAMRHKTAWNGIFAMARSHLTMLLWYTAPDIFIYYFLIANQFLRLRNAWCQDQQPPHYCLWSSNPIRVHYHMVSCSLVVYPSPDVEIL